MVNHPDDMSEAEYESVLSSLIGLGNASRIQEKYAPARQYYESGLRLARQYNDERGIIRCLNNLGLIEEKEDNNEVAREYFQTCLQYWEKVDDSASLANARNNLGMVASNTGDFPAARKFFHGARYLYRELDDEVGVGRTLFNEARIEIKLTRFHEALTLLAATLVVFSEENVLVEMHSALVEFAAVVAKSDVNTGAVLLGFAEHVREEIPVEDPSLNMDGNDPDVSAIRAGLTTIRFEELWAQGRSLTTSMMLRVVASAAA